MGVAPYWATVSRASGATMPTIPTPAMNSPIDRASDVTLPPRILRGELDDAGITMPRGEEELGDGDGERETAGARAPRVDEENAFAFLHEGPMGMTGEHRGEPRCRWFQAELPEVMNDVEDVAPHLDHVIGGQLEGPRTRVIVTPDRTNRGEGPERVQDGRCSDVSAMNDEIRAAKRLQRLRPHQTVGVGDHTDNARARRHTQWHADPSYV